MGTDIEYLVPWACTYHRIYIKKNMSDIPLHKYLVPWACTYHRIHIKYNKCGGVGGGGVRHFSHQFLHKVA